MHILMVVGNQEDFSTNTKLTLCEDYIKHLNISVNTFADAFGRAILKIKEYAPDEVYSESDFYDPTERIPKHVITVKELLVHLVAYELMIPDHNTTIENILSEIIPSKDYVYVYKIKSVVLIPVTESTVCYIDKLKS